MKKQNNKKTATVKKVLIIVGAIAAGAGIVLGIMKSSKTNDEYLTVDIYDTSKTEQPTDIIEKNSEQTSVSGITNNVSEGKSIQDTESFSETFSDLGYQGVSVKDMMEFSYNNGTISDKNTGIIYTVADSKEDVETFMSYTTADYIKNVKSVSVARMDRESVMRTMCFNFADEESVEEYITGYKRSFDTPTVKINNASTVELRYSDEKDGITYYGIRYITSANDGTWTSNRVHLVCQKGTSVCVFTAIDQNESTEALSAIENACENLNMTFPSQFARSEVTGTK